MNRDQEDDALLIKYLPYIKKIASKYKNYIEFDDAVQEGLMGFNDAIKKYDPSKNTKFLTYATIYIKKRILRSIENTNRLIRIPVYIQQLKRDIYKVRKVNPLITHEELSKQLNVTTNMISYAELKNTIIELDNTKVYHNENPHKIWIEEANN